MTPQEFEELYACAIAHTAKRDQLAYNFKWGECDEGRKLRKDAELLEALEDGEKTAQQIGSITCDHASNVRIRVNRLIREGLVKSRSAKMGRNHVTLYSLKRKNHG